MRTTVNLEPDVAAAVDALRRREQVSMSAAINLLIRDGLANDSREVPSFEQRTSPMGLHVDVANVAEALELLEGPTAR